MFYVASWSLFLLSALQGESFIERWNLCSVTRIQSQMPPRLKEFYKAGVAICLLHFGLINCRCLNICSHQHEVQTRFTLDSWIHLLSTLIKLPNFQYTKPATLSKWEKSKFLISTLFLHESSFSTWIFWKFSPWHNMPAAAAEKQPCSQCTLHVLGRHAWNPAFHSAVRWLPLMIPLSAWGTGKRWVGFLGLMLLQWEH